MRISGISNSNYINSNENTAHHISNIMIMGSGPDSPGDHTKMQLQASPYILGLAIHVYILTVFDDLLFVTQNTCIIVRNDL